MAASGRLFARLPLGREDFDTAAGLFNRRHGGLRGAEYRQRDLGFDFATAEDPHTSLGPAQDARLDQRRGVDRGRRLEPAGVDRLLDAAEIDLVELAREHRVLEAALGQAAMQRHLAAFEALDADAGARGLTLAAATGSLALAGADATADALSRLAGAVT